MNRLVAAAFFTIAAIALAACGDSGDHLFDFAHTGGSGSLTTPGPNGSATAGPAAVSKIVLSLVGASPDPNTAGTYQLNVGIYGSNGQPVSANTLLSSQVVLTSNASCELGFVLPASPADTDPSSTFEATVNTDYAPGAGIVIGYTPTTNLAACSPSNVTITAGLQSGAVTAGTLSLFGGDATVTGLTLAPLSVPNPSAAGVYPFFVTLTGTANGGAPGLLPGNESIANPVTLTTNNTCVVAFGTSPNIATGTPTQALTITSTSDVPYLFFNPGSATSSCPSTGTVIVSASATGVTTQTYTFTNDLPVTSVHRKLSQ